MSTPRDAGVTGGASRLLDPGLAAPVSAAAIAPRGPWQLVQLPSAAVWAVLRLHWVTAPDDSRSRRAGLASAWWRCTAPDR